MITHTIDQFILDPKSKQYKVNITNLKNLIWQNFKFFNCEKKNSTHDTPSEVAW